MIKDILPPEVYEEIKSHLYNKGNAAERGWTANEDNEDSLTGALGESLSTEWSTSVYSNGKIWKWRVWYKKFSSRKFEPQHGADGLFQIEIEDEQTRQIYRKGIIFQAKKHNNRNQAELIEQVGKMEKLAPGSTVVIDFGPDAYRAFPSKEIIGKTSREVGEVREQASKLADVLAKDFLECIVGQLDLYYDAPRKILNVPKPDGTTQIIRLHLRHRIEIDVRSS